MQLSIIKFQVLELELKKKKIDNTEIEIKKTFDFDFSVQYDDKFSDFFFIIFDIKVENPNEFELKLKYNTIFRTSEIITDEFKNSTFPTLNAPAIAFPFLRSFISTLTLNAGFEPALLPSINFEKIKKA